MTNANESKLYALAGVSRKAAGQPFKARWANDNERVKQLIADGQVDIDIVELPEPMNKLDAVNYLLKIDFGGTRQEVTDALLAAQGKRTPVEKVAKVRAEKPAKAPKVPKEPKVKAEKPARAPRVKKVVAAEAVAVEVVAQATDASASGESTEAVEKFELVNGEVVRQREEEMVGA